MAENIDYSEIETQEEQTEQEENDNNEKTDESDVLPDCLNWNCDEVADWIEQLGFPYYRVRRTKHF